MNSFFFTSVGFTASPSVEYHASYQLRIYSLARQLESSGGHWVPFFFLVRISMKIKGVNGQSPLSMLPVIRQAGRITIHPTNHTCSALWEKWSELNRGCECGQRVHQRSCPAGERLSPFEQQSAGVICVAISCESWAFASYVCAPTWNSCIQNWCRDATGCLFFFLTIGGRRNHSPKRWKKWDVGE